MFAYNSYIALSLFNYCARAYGCTHTFKTGAYEIIELMKQSENCNASHVCIYEHVELYIEALTAYSTIGYRPEFYVCVCACECMCVYVYMH